MAGAVVSALLLTSLFPAASASPLQPSEVAHGKQSVRHANHIFNAIHSSLRQWGSSYNHNGMSFFFATVPEDTELYHGDHAKDPITGIEWLAFEPEHALVFARGRRPGGPGGPGGPHPPPGGPGKGNDNGPPPPPPPGVFGQHPLSLEEALGAPELGGWLHTYRTKKDLHLLYLDGLSAGKTSNGTTDSQDYVLLDPPDGDRPVFWDGVRAEQLCELANKDWAGRVDGILRMEAGFEIILCDFAKNLDIVRVTRAHGGFVTRAPQGDSFSYLRAVADRYDGIGAHRIRLNYEDFVTAYTYDIELFNDDSPMPRLQNVSKEDRDRIKDDIQTLILMNPSPFERASFDWRSTVDMIVTRYASRLQYLVSDEISSNIEELHGELDRALRPFIDYAVRDVEAETTRCASQFLPRDAPHSLAEDVVLDVSRSLCSALLFAYNATDTNDSASDLKVSTGTKEEKRLAAVKRLNDIIDYLDWTVWKQCRGCGYDEICFIPIWPYGGPDDHRNPRCTNASALVDKRGYWGHFGPGGGRRPPPP